MNFDCRIYYYRTNENSATRTVDLMGERYLSSMNVIQSVLENYVDDADSKCVKKQLCLRKGTIILSQLIYLSKVTKDYNQFKMLIKSKEYRDCLKNVSIKTSSYKKRVLYLLSSLKCYRILFNLLRK